MKLKTSLSFVVAALSSPVFGQGDLTPPGAPAPTMKTLEEVHDRLDDAVTATEALQGDARTAITSLPYTISQSGSYYLTGSLTTSSSSAIVVEASQVTIDLNGFSLDGSSGSTSSGAAVYVAGASGTPYKSIVVRNGIVKGFGKAVHLEYVESGRIEKLVCSEQEDDGIDLNNVTGVSVRHCHIDSPSGHGISIQNSDANYVTHCQVIDTGTHGVFLSSGNGNFLKAISVKTASSNGFDLRGDGNILKSCKVAEAGGYGVELAGSSSDDSSGNLINDCSVTGATGRGFYLTYATENRITNNRVSDTSEVASTSYGFYFHSTRCVNNVIINNTSVEHTDNYSFSASDVYGPELSASDISSTTQPHPLGNLSL